jgi:hypothetical protein
LEHSNGQEAGERFARCKTIHVRGKYDTTGVAKTRSRYGTRKKEEKFLKKKKTPAATKQQQDLRKKKDKMRGIHI